ncbi:putative Zn-dependent protease [Singulisphaera acidiphila DSM 18658]|uniref:Putative Zn-dependent protease n=2 Tax=Singulisphaera acidiphila TaxID=466153 RepID=L0DNX3_SINAD|nr:putative Zn-dependent protease [Singulisphaera acidiphila DSM 18658]
MNRIVARCRDAVRRIRTRALCPDVEGLEDRKLLSTANGGHWYYPIRITYSFVPDGTNIGGVPSNLFQAFNAVAPTATWQDQFRKAAAIWQAVAGFNIVEVPDNGAPIGGVGNQQNDPRFGDIRIGGTAMHPAYLGYSLLPPPINGGPDAGDIVMNTAQSWKINNDYDILSVAIHEFGHSLGMGHSDIVAANMYTYYAWMKQSLQPDDIAGIRNIYGGVPADPTNNATAATAIDLTPLIDGQGRMSYNAGYVTSFSNFEWYKITVPSTTTGTMKVTMQSSNLSSLSPRLNVINSSLVGVGQAIAQNVYGATVTYTVTGVTPGQTYYILAQSAQTGPGSNGAFGLLVNFGNSSLAPIAPYNTTVAQQPDQGVNGWMAETTPKQMRRLQRRMLARHTQNHGDDDPGHQVIAVKLGKGRPSYADALLAPPRRHSRLPQPSRFRKV